MRCVESKDEKRLLEDEDTTNRWEEYVWELYRNEAGLRQGTIEKEGNAKKTADKVFNIRERNKNVSRRNEKVIKKAVEVGRISTGLLKSMKDKGKKALMNVCREIYDSGLSPKKFLETLLIPLKREHRS